MLIVYFILMLFCFKFMTHKRIFQLLFTLPKTPLSFSSLQWISHRLETFPVHAHLQKSLRFQGFLAGFLLSLQILLLHCKRPKQAYLLSTLHRLPVTIKRLCQKRYRLFLQLQSLRRRLPSLPRPPPFVLPVLLLTTRLRPLILPPLCLPRQKQSHYFRQTAPLDLPRYRRHKLPRATRRLLTRRQPPRECLLHHHLFRLILVFHFVLFHSFLHYHLLVGCFLEQTHHRKLLGSSL